MNDYSKIWQETEAANDKQLMQYLKGEMKPGDEHVLENQIINSSFESDAVDGLREMPSQQIQSSVSDLNMQLQKMLPAKKKIKRNKAYSLQQWIILTVIAVLVIILITYGFVQLMHH